MTKHWIVNASERTVRMADKYGDEKFEGPKSGEFFWSGTYADAMTAGSRRRLAEEALSSTPGFVLVADRIEPNVGDQNTVLYAIEKLKVELEVDGFDVWREGTGLVVLGRLPTSSDPFTMIDLSEDA